MNPAHAAAWLVLTTLTMSSAAANDDLLIEADALRELLSDQADLVLIDVRPEADYSAGHLPGARSIKLAQWREAFDSDATAEQWGRGLGDLGIGPGTRVVVYDKAFTPGAARAWWLLRYWGVNASVLNGGYAAWTAAGAPTVTEPPAPLNNPSPFPASPHPGRRVTGDALRAMIEQNAAPRLIDTRSADEYGAGHVPGALSLDWAELVDPSGKLLPKQSLLRRLEQAGVDPQAPAITYCRSGGRASVTMFALELLGAEQAASYYGGWTEWCADKAEEVGPPPQ